MSSSVPDSVSFDELKDLRDEAAAREAQPPKSDAHYDGKTKEEVVDIAMDLVQEAIAKCNDPMVHKIMMMMIIDNFLEWHTKAGMNQMENGEPRSVVCWLRDAGKFQAIANILDTVNTGPHDWTTGD